MATCLPGKTRENREDEEHEARKHGGPEEYSATAATVTICHAAPPPCPRAGPFVVDRAHPNARQLELLSGMV